jgi:hypothetical protein
MGIRPKAGQSTVVMEVPMVVRWMDAMAIPSKVVRWMVAMGTPSMACLEMVDLPMVDSVKADSSKDGLARGGSWTEIDWATADSSHRRRGSSHRHRGSSHRHRDLLRRRDRDRMTRRTSTGPC